MTTVDFIDESGCLAPSHWNALAAFAPRKALAQLPQRAAEKHHCDRLGEKASGGALRALLLQAAGGGACHATIPEIQSRKA